ncbi:MAG: tRNA 2-thiocytidine(32) synthetase TtcA [Candidatus Omnitrophota bacterium]|nr:MAG: tRNA 2-thiocytidine(32) synthetase TtcA [Candidatus Omnitrophota bacterium]
MQEVNQEKIKLRGAIRNIYKKTGKAINDYQMIKEGDKVLVGVSGGKDSLSLLKVLILRKRHVPIDFKLKACFIESRFMPVEKNLLEEYFREQEVEYAVKQLDIETPGEKRCFWCSWNKRKILFQTAKELNCNKIALAHHLDDIVETILMNLFFHGEVSSMKPVIELFGGELSIIRPFCYLEKREIEKFYSQFAFPPLIHNCPYAQDSRRLLIKNTISLLKKEFPHIKVNIFRALRKEKIKKDYLL